MRAQAAVLALLLASLDACFVRVTVDRTAAQEGCFGSTLANQSICNDLQSVLASLSTAILGQDCVQIDVVPGTYVLTEVFKIQQSLVLRAISSGVFITCNIPEVNPNEQLYVGEFANASLIVIEGLTFTDFPGILGFENVTNLVVKGCTFSRFAQGALDIYNSWYLTVDNCTFHHNGPTYVVKRQEYRGHSGGLSIAYNLDNPTGSTPRVYVGNTCFTNNSVQTRAELTTQFFVNAAFINRGGGASIIAAVADGIDVTIESCSFVDNSALTLGGGMFFALGGKGNHSIVVNKTTFINNRSYGSGGGGGVFVGFLYAGSLSRVVFFRVHNSKFVENSATYGGGAYAIVGEEIPSENLEIGNYVEFRNCSFERNDASRFGAAIALVSPRVLVSREKVTPADIINCDFTRNMASSRSGVLALAYYAARLEGLNYFYQNRGSALAVIGSVLYIADYATLQIINTTSTDDDTALSVLSLGQIILHRGANINFTNNTGSFGSSFGIRGLRYLPDIFRPLVYNPLCFLRHNRTELDPTQWANDEIRITFVRNSATVGAAIFTDNAESCSWVQREGDVFSTEQFYSLPEFTFMNNSNVGHTYLEYEPRWNVQGPVTNFTLYNDSIVTYPGNPITLSLAATDELGHPTISVFQLLQPQEDDATESLLQNSYVFYPSAGVVANLSNPKLQTYLYFLNHSSEEFEVQVTTLFAARNHTSILKVSVLSCPTGMILEKHPSYSFLTCRCNTLNPNIITCNGSSIIFKSGLWASRRTKLNVYGGHFASHPCPPGYCRCQLDSGSCLSVFNDFKLSDTQCSCFRSGVLCGRCVENKGVSALLNRCITCHNASGALVAMLVICNACIFIFLMWASPIFPSWLYPCTFYLQLLPFITEYFPVTFHTIHPYLYYISSGLSFYFVYDFCLYSNMSPLVSYFIRYLPLLTALIVCPIILTLKHHWSPYFPWNGLWWIVVLMYTHIIHTSVSILNCPRVTSNETESNVWYINGNIECFTQGHTPLAILSIIVLLLCTFAMCFMYIITRASKRPVWLGKLALSLIPPLIRSYNEDMRWFGSVELARRAIFVLMIVIFPQNLYPSIFMIIIIITIYGYIQPYKHRLSNLLEVVIAVDVLVMLLLNITDQITDLLHVIPDQAAPEGHAITNNSTCSDNDNIKGLSPFVKLLVPFYYFPLAMTMMAAAVWVGQSLRKLKKKKFEKLEKRKHAGSILDYTLFVDPINSSHIEFYELPGLNAIEEEQDI